MNGRGPVEPGSPEWHRRLDARLVEELETSEEGWYWLSFADPTRPKGDQFLGVAVVSARGMATAVLEAHALGINPGGEVMAIPLPPEHVPPPESRERLLSRDEAEAL